MYRSMYVLRDFKGGWPPIPLLAGKDTFLYVGIVDRKTKMELENPPPLSNYHLL